MVDMASAPNCSWRDIDPFIEAYERRQAERGEAELSEFLPPPDHPHYQNVLVELVRVDLELRFRRGRRKRIEAYLEEFPGLRQDREALDSIAYEEYRLRCRARECPAVAEYQERFGIDLADWMRLHAPGSDPLRSPGTTTSSAPGGAQDGLELTALIWLHSADSEAPAHPATRAVAELLLSRDPAGMGVLGFEVIRELGRGVKSRVYLAQQQDLADRKVVLKVSSDVLREPHLLAQLQHTHIVPIYSVHTATPFQVFSMPYFGATTLADVGCALRQQKGLPPSGRWLADLLAARGVDQEASPRLRRLESLTYVQSILWLGARLAEGLEHAHQKGIVHGDIKPANLLIGDDGQPLLLDFNLARELHQNGDTPDAYFGGTLPYMPPEQLRAPSEEGCPTGPQGDLYALGVVLSELLTGRPLYALRSGPLEEVIAEMRRDRQGPLPPLRKWNPAISPAEESILHHCLASDPAHRYASITQLREDLERHEKHLPVRHAPEPSLRERASKWCRRHPHLASGWALLLLAVLALGALLIVSQHVRRLDALEQFRGFHEDFLQCGFLASAADLEAGTRRLELEKTRATLARYHLLEDERWAEASHVTLLPAEDQGRLRRELSEVLVLRGRALRQEARQRISAQERDELLHEALRTNERAEACAPRESLRRILTQRSVLLLQLGKEKEAEAVLREANQLPGSLKADEYLLTWGEMTREECEMAVAHLDRIVQNDPQDTVLWFQLAIYYGQLGRYEKALACYNASIALWPKSDLAFHGRSLAHLELGELAEALADCDQAIRLQPDYPAWYFNRALVRFKQGDAKGALADLDVAIDKGIPAVRAWLLRARVREKLGDGEGARRDREEALRRRPTDPDSWAERGVERMKTDRKEALEDIEEALRRDPRCRLALLAKAQVLSEDRDRPERDRTEAAVAVLDEAVKHYPLAADFRASRGVLLARLGKRDAALVDAREALRLDRSPAIRYQVAGIYFLTAAHSPDHRLVAFSLLGLALLEGYGFELLAIDPELASVRGSQDLDRLVQAIQKVRGEKPRRRAD
jgi:serine/threonine protein kinase/Tfp pilus assembly protein PilF